MQYIPVMINLWRNWNNRNPLWHAAFLLLYTAEKVPTYQRSAVQRTACKPTLALSSISAIRCLRSSINMTSCLCEHWAFMCSACAQKGHCLCITIVRAAFGSLLSQSTICVCADDADSLDMYVQQVLHQAPHGLDGRCALVGDVHYRRLPLLLDGLF